MTSRRPLTVASSVVVDRPAADVAAVVLDWRHDPRWRAGVTDLDVEPAGRAVEGQRQVERLRFAGLRFTTPTRVTAAAPLAASFEGGNGHVAVSGRREVRAVGDDRCEVRTVVRLTGRRAMRLLLPVLAPAYRRRDAADLRRLATLVRSLS
jgi:hypothetical protein